MSALVGYGSSDEDEEVSEERRNQGIIRDTRQHERPALEVPASTNGRSAGATLASAIESPLMGPAGPPQPTEPDINLDSSSTSPYTAQRSAIRNLTLPTNPNFEIPRSPPGSPTDTDQKFAHFLELKKKGVHFNAKLGSSSTLKNPSLLPKLMRSAGVEDPKQYATTLPLELWDPLDFPEWAYKEELGRSQEDVTKEKEEETARSQRENIEFVSAADTASSGRAGTVGISSKVMKGSAAERVMAGLNREWKT